MIKQDDVLQHFKYKGRRKSKNVTKSKAETSKAARNSNLLEKQLEKIKKKNTMKKLRLEARDIRIRKNKKYEAYKRALNETKNPKSERVKRAFKEFKAARDNHLEWRPDLKDTGDSLNDHIGDLAESKKANDRSRQQHGEVKVRSYRRNGKIVRGHKRARRSSKNR